jgi:hypothetical protein
MIQGNKSQEQDKAQEAAAKPWKRAVKLVLMLSAGRSYLL